MIKSKVFTLAVLLFAVSALISAQETDPEADQYFSTADFAGAHILVAYTGAQRAKPTVDLTKEEALMKAKDLIAELTANPDKFDQLAKEESDGPSGPNGGDLGSWQRGRMVPEFDTAISQLKIGEITKTPVETSFGFHIIKRKPLEGQKEKFYTGMVIVKTYKDAANAPVKADRTKEEALAELQEIKKQVTAANFEEMIAKSDIPDGAKLPVVALSQPFLPAIKTAFTSLKLDQVSDVVEVPNFGYLLIRRDKVVRLAGAHLLIAYQGAQAAAPSITRTKEEALATAQKMAAELAAKPQNFANTAERHSDAPDNNVGGDWGFWFKGEKIPEIENAILALKPGEVGATPVETIYGFHIVKRNPVD